MNPLGYIINETASKEVEFTVVNENREFIVAEGIIQEAETENRNKRWYSAKDLFNEIMCQRQQELVQSGNFKGEAGHPMDTSLARQQTIHPPLTQVWYQKLWMEGNFVKAWFRGTNNDLGREFNDDLKDGQKPSFSLRALGRIENVGGKAYVKGLKMITYDRVYYPSHKTAYTQKIVSGSGISSAAASKIETPTAVKEAGNMMVVNESGIITPIFNEQVRNYLIHESANLQTIRNNFDTLYDSIIIDEAGNNVVLTTADHETIIVPVERHIQNEIMNFCSSI